MSAASRTSLPPLRYLDGATVEASMPPIEERLRLAEVTMRALASGAAQLPPKIGVSPRPADSFAHAMPAHLRGDSPADDLIGIKWVLGFPTNNDLGIPGIHAVAILNDPATGVPVAILDAGPITAHRTAAVSGLAIRNWGPSSGASVRAAIIGAGTQGRAHLPIVGHLLPDVDLAIFDRDTARAEALVALAGRTDGIGRAHAAATPEDAIRDAAVVITAASFGPVKQVMGPDWLAPDALVVPVDYATYASAALARDARLFLVDERAQFEKNREIGEFDDYPDPHATIGEALIAGTRRPASGRVMVTHLGVGLSDVVFGNAILRAATEAGRGTVLTR